MLKNQNNRVDTLQKKCKVCNLSEYSYSISSEESFTPVLVSTDFLSQKQKTIIKCYNTETKSKNDSLYLVFDEASNNINITSPNEDISNQFSANNITGSLTLEGHLQQRLEFWSLLISDQVIHVANHWILCLVRRGEDVVKKFKFRITEPRRVTDQVFWLKRHLGNSPCAVFSS